MRDPEKNYFGRLCPHHPAGKGERRRSRRDCVFCDIERSRKYRRRHSVTGIPAKDAVRVGYISELLVAADLNARCGRAYPNPEPQTPDDVYAKTSLGWRTVQVKKAQVNRKTGHMRMRTPNARSRAITSEILALVDLEGMRVLYAPNGTPLPPELPHTPVPICSKLVVFASPEEVCHSSNISVLTTDAPNTYAQSSASATHQTKRNTVTPAKCCSQSSNGARPPKRVSGNTERLEA